MRNVNNSHEPYDSSHVQYLLLCFEPVIYNQWFIHAVNCRAGVILMVTGSARTIKLWMIAAPRVGKLERGERVAGGFAYQMHP